MIESLTAERDAERAGQAEELEAQAQGFAEKAA
jgi:hypothetical protein